MSKHHGGDWSQLDWRRVAGCGRSVIAGQVGVHRLRNDDGASAYFSGVLSCGSVWLCPVCSAKIRIRRSMEVELAATRHTDQGGRLVMVTLTLRHQRDTPLKEAREALTGAWRSIQQSEWWRKSYRPRLRGQIRALEVTRSDSNGWHPHLHLLLFVRPGEVLDLEEFRSQLMSRWADRIESRMGRRARPSDLRGVHVQDLDHKAAGYVSKIGSEIARSDSKGGDGLSVVLDALGDSLDTGDASGFAMWSEWAGAMKGQRALVWSNGLRYDLVPDLEELTDEQIAEQDEGGELVAVIEPDTYRRLTASPDLLVCLLETIESGGRLPEWCLPPPRLTG